MNENIKELLRKVSADESLAAKFTEISDPDEAYALASSIQEGFTKEEFIQTMSKMRDMSEQQGELSDDDLAQVAGGLSGGEASALISTTIASPTAALMIASYFA